MTTVILLVLVLFSFFLLFSEGAPAALPEGEDGKRVEGVVTKFGDQITELRQILKGSTLLLQAKNLSRPMTEDELAYEGLSSYEERWTSDGILFTVPDSSPEVKDWVENNQQTLAKMSKEFATVKWLDFSGGLHAAVTRFN